MIVRDVRRVSAGRVFDVRATAVQASVGDYAPPVSICGR